MSTFEFGVGLFPTEPLQKMIHLAKVSEELGFTHIWVGDSHLIWREAYVNMAAMALNTTKVKLGTGVTNPLTRHPSVLASAYAAHPERFVRRPPHPPKLPTASWINPPDDTEETAQ